MDRPFPAYNGDGPYVFVSYSHRDSSAVFPEITRLKDQGFNIWYDEGIEAGTEWSEALAGAIKQSNLFLYFVTPDSVQSQNCRNEVNFAVENEVPIIAVHLEETHLPDGLSLTLSARQAILKHDMPTEAYQQKLQTRIASYLDQTLSPSAVIDDHKNTSISMILIGAVVVIVLISGLFFYNRQETIITADVGTPVATNTALAESSAKSPSDNEGGKIDIADLHSIAVLPFANMSTNEEIGFFADGLSELEFRVSRILH